MNPVTEIKNAAQIMLEWLGDGAVPVPIEIANRRAEVCLHCPEHRRVHWYEFAKEKVAQTIAEQIVVKNQMGVRLQREEDMGVCRICGCVLVLKTSVPLKHILKHTDEKTMNAFPSHCWIRTEQTK